MDMNSTGIYGISNQFSVNPNNGFRLACLIPHQTGRFPHLPDTWLTGCLYNVFRAA